MPMNVKLVRDAMISARAVLLTASHDKAEDLSRPERQTVIQSRIDGLTVAIKEIDKDARSTKAETLDVVGQHGAKLKFTEIIR